VPLDDDRVAQLVADDPPLDPLPPLLTPPVGLAAARANEPSGGGPAVMGSVPSVVGE
jgi:hypothetical protein